MRDYDQQLVNIRNDKVSGSREIVLKVISCFQSFAEAEHDQFLKEVYELGRECIDAQPDMAAIKSFVDELIKEVEKNPHQETILQFCKHYQKNLQQLLDELIEKTSQVVKHGDIMLTFSRSSTVEEVLLALHKKRLKYKIYAAESLPGGEGKVLGKRLKNSGVNIEVILDADIDKTLEKCDLVLFGADFIEKKRVLNKVGSRTVAEKAEARKIPCYVIADCSKEGVYPDKKPEPLFEWVPMERITLITNRRSNQDHR